MRRSICHSEPTAALAGEMGNWKFVYTTASHLPKGTKIRFDMGSRGGPNDWQLPQTNLKTKANLIWAEAGGKTLGASELEVAQTAAYEFTLPLELKPGEEFSIHLGTPEKEAAPKKGNACQKMVQRKRPFILYLDTKGKGDYKEPEVFHLDVRGGPLKTLRVIAPSIVSRNKRFDVIIRFEDMYGNLTSNAPEGTLIDLSYEHLRENLNWKLFVPETGFISLPNLYFNEEGIYKIQLRNLKSGEVFFSSPIKCLAESGLSLYWGLLHGETDRVDSAENIESYLRHMRDDRALQFVATSCFESEEETPNDVWKGIVAQVAEFNEDNRFVALLGFQWQGEAKKEGLRHFLYAKDAKPIMRRKDSKHNALSKILKTNNPKEMLAIPSFSMGKQTCYDFSDFNPEFERVVEIYNAWGSQECSAKEGNALPVRASKNGIGEIHDGSLIKALNQGCRFGFVAGGYDDRGCYGTLFESEQAQYSPGLTAILAKEHTRASLIEALQARSCYATTGEKIILGLQIAGLSMGCETDTKSRPGLEFNRHITGYAIGTAPLSEVALIRNGQVMRQLPFQGERCVFEIDDTDLLSTIALEAKGDKGERPPFVYYYLRVTQTDGHIAWSSPIWVDLTARSAAIAPVKKLKKKSL